MDILETYNIENVSRLNAELISKIIVDNRNFASSKLRKISQSNRFLLCSIQYRPYEPINTGICRVFDTHTNELISDLAIRYDPNKIYSSFSECILTMSYDSKYVATVYTTYKPYMHSNITNQVDVWDIYGNKHVTFKYQYNTANFKLDEQPPLRCEFSPNINSLLVSYLNKGNTIMLYDIHLKYPVYMLNTDNLLVDFSLWNNNIITALSTYTPKKGLKSQQKNYIHKSKNNYMIKMAGIPFNAFGVRASLIWLIVKGNRDRLCKKPRLPTELWDWIADEFFQGSWKLTT
jgi:WD40 repeat protein